MTTYRRRVASLLLCSVLMTSVGCTSMKTIRPVAVPGEAAAFPNLKQGDTVAVRTKAGRTARFVIQQVDGDTIIAPDGVRYPSADIAELKLRSFSAPKTSGLIAGVVAGAVVLVAAASAAAAGSLLGGGG